jgi:hypothetical protein
MPLAFIDFRHGRARLPASHTDTDRAEKRRQPWASFDHRLAALALDETTVQIQ